MKKIVIIPSYNEEKNIGKVIKGIRKNHSNLDILVINDCSDDKTEEIAKYENAYVVNHVLRAGYGASLQTGYKYALHKNYDIVIQLDWPPTPSRSRPTWATGPWPRPWTRRGRRGGACSSWP